MAINDTLELVVRGTVGNQQHIHTQHFRAKTLDNGPAQLATQWTASCNGPYRGMFASSDYPIQLLRVNTVCGSVPLPAAYEEAVPAAIGFGGRSSPGAAEPPFLACTVREKTALAGRTRQGRFFIGGLREPDSDLDTFTQAYLDLVQAYITSLTTAFPVAGTGNFQLVVHSRKLASAVPPPQCETSSAPIVSFVINNRVTTMRSRKAGSGL